ncbi:MAG: hypothetical protein ACI9WS_001238 [Paraglaciecola psychrophila]|jgi:hypothetical protein
MSSEGKRRKKGVRNKPSWSPTAVMLFFTSTDVVWVLAAISTAWLAVDSRCGRFKKTI